MSEEEYFRLKEMQPIIKLEDKEEEIKQLKEQLQQKENIIKEVREYLQGTINRWEDYEQFYEVVVEDKYILEILDKGE